MGRRRTRRRGRRRSLGAAGTRARHRQRARLRELRRLRWRSLRGLRARARRQADARRRAGRAAAVRGPPARRRANLLWHGRVERLRHRPRARTDPGRDAQALDPIPRLSLLICYRAAPMRVGNLTIEPDVLLAPMAAVTDLPFRTVIEEIGVGITITEFLSAHALVEGAKKAHDKMTPSLDGRRFGVQIFGREAEPLARAAKMAIDIGASLVDI